MRGERREQRGCSVLGARGGVKWELREKGSMGEGLGKGRFEGAGPRGEGVAHGLGNSLGASSPPTHFF